MRRFVNDVNWILLLHDAAEDEHRDIAALRVRQAARSVILDGNTPSRG